MGLKLYLYATERKRDSILSVSYTHLKNIDGFRCDMAEMVPVEFWEWAIPQVKEQYPLSLIHIYFLGMAQSGKPVCVGVHQVELVASTQVIVFVCRGKAIDVYKRQDL